MIREGHDNTEFFVGTEIETSPAFGKSTLFVVGLQAVDIISWKLSELNGKRREPIRHIYFGANMSFPNPKVDDTMTWSQWENMILPFLEQGIWCTLDLDVSAVEGLLEGSLTEQALFIPMISVKMPYIKQLGYNATIKLDDKDFNATNPGVWCHSIHDLMNRDKFTSWDLYTKDETIK
jgi:hypothetical protein